MSPEKLIEEILARRSATFGTGAAAGVLCDVVRSESRATLWAYLRALRDAGLMKDTEPKKQGGG